MADEPHLKVHSADPEPPIQGRAVVDVANVCRARELPVPHRTGVFHQAARLRLVVDRWREIHGADADLRFVVDHALRADFAFERALDQWDQLISEFDVTGQRKADGMILDCAMTERRFVISDDRFRDFRRKLPWIERQPDRFRKPKRDGQELRFPPSGIKHEEDYVVTRAEEKSELTDLGYHHKRFNEHWRKMLATRWRCRDHRCSTNYSEYRQRLLVPARGHGDRTVCPTCEAPLERVGPRGAWLEIKVMNGDRTGEWGRFVLDAGPAIEVGRGREDYGVSLDTMVEDDAAQSRLSRQHVKLAVDENRRLSVVDLESSNGTVVHDSTKQFTKLVPHEPREVRDRGWVVLGDGAVCLVASAREFVPSAHAPRQRSGDDRVTRL